MGDTTTKKLKSGKWQCFFHTKDWHYLRAPHQVLKANQHPPMQCCFICIKPQQTNGHMLSNFVAKKYSCQHNWSCIKATNRGKLLYLGPRVVALNIPSMGHFNSWNLICMMVLKYHWGLQLVALMRTWITPAMEALITSNKTRCR